MWFFIVLGFLLFSIFLIWLGNKRWDMEKHPTLWRQDENISITGVALTIIFSIVAVVMIIAIVINHTNVSARVERDMERYNALTYKMESTTCRDKFGFLSKEVIDEVQEWNKDVKYYQASQRNLWVGVFYPNVFDDYKIIDYYSYNPGD